jgi:CRP/FNR family transcriptional regulator, cyclic AMP receptor protein
MLVPLHEQLRLLSAADVLEPLSEDELVDFAQRNPDRRLQQGEFLYNQFDSAERLYLVKKGKIRIYKTNPEGEEITLAIATEGDVFGEMAFTGQRLRGAHAMALEPSLVVSLRREDLKELILSKPEVGLRLIERLSERLRLREEQLEDVTLKEVPARLASLILRVLDSEGVKTSEGYKIPTHYTHEQLGSMIGARRVAVTRAFRVLRETGAVEIRERTLHVTNLEILKKVAEQ